MKAQAFRFSNVSGGSSVIGLIAIAVFALVIAFLGGSSRPDAVQISALRPLCALLLIPAAYYWQKGAAANVRVPMLVLGLILVWMVIQIIPLPPSMWQSLPDRELVAELDRLVGIDDPWRPISMVPSRSYNALASLIVPIAAIALAITFRFTTRDLFVLISGLGLLDAFLCFAQLVTGASGPFYLYSITNRGFAVGIFANENHSAVFSGLVMLIAARLVLARGWNAQLPWLRIFASLTFVIALLAVIVSGSRAGLVLGLFALSASLVMAYTTFTYAVSTRDHRSRSAPSKTAANGSNTGFGGKPGRFLVIAVVLTAIIGALFILNGRAAGLEGILNEDAFDDLRWQLWPTLQTMMGTHWLLGTGFGSFEEVYHIYEPTELLYSYYVNQAHNDLAQLVIEGGAVFVALLVWLLVWVAFRLGLMLSAGKNNIPTVIFWAVSAAILIASSAVDYPLRAPTFQAVAIWLLVAFSTEQVQTRNAVEIRARS